MNKFWIFFFSLIMMYLICINRNKFITTSSNNIKIRCNTSKNVKLQDKCDNPLVINTNLAEYNENRAQLCAAMSAHIYCVHRYGDNWINMVKNSNFTEDYKQRFRLCEPKVFRSEPVISPSGVYDSLTADYKKYIQSNDLNTQVGGIIDSNNSNDRFPARCATGYHEETNQIFLIFRGTKMEVKTELWTTIHNWFHSNLHVNQELFHDVLVHRGFKWFYLSLRNEIVDHLKDLALRHPTANVIVTGHSLGGGAATIAAFDLAITAGLDRHISLYTFGSPRVGSPEFVNKFLASPNLNNFRIVNQYDVVPTMPFNYTPSEESVLGYGGLADIFDFSIFKFGEKVATFVIKTQTGFGTWHYEHVPDEYWYKHGYPGNYIRVGRKNKLMMLMGVPDGDRREKYKRISVEDHMHYLGEFTGAPWEEGDNPDLAVCTGYHRDLYKEVPRYPIQIQDDGTAKLVTE